MTRCVWIFLVSLLAIGLVGCVSGERLARKPVDPKSRYCKAGGSLYRAGGILFCADENVRWAARITYSVNGNAAKKYQQQIADVVSVAGCLTGRMFEQTPDGQFKITIDDKVEPPAKNESIGSSYSTHNLNAHLGASRTGSTKINLVNGTRAMAGNKLQAGLWAFLNIGPPMPVAAAQFSFEQGRDPGPLHRVPDDQRFCKEEKSTLIREGHVFFCAQTKQAWPRRVAYAVIGDESFEQKIPAIAAFASRLSQVPYRPDSKAQLLVILTQTKLTKASYNKLLEDNHVEALDGPSISFENDFFSKLGPLPGWMSSKQYSHSMSDGEAFETSVIGLHNRDELDTESEIQESFLDVLRISMPAFAVPDACVADQENLR